MIYIINSYYSAVSDYILDGISSNKILHVKEVPVVNRYRLWKYLSYIGINKFSEKIRFKKDYISLLKSLSEDDSIIFFDNYSFEELICINNLLDPKVKKIIWYWNVLRRWWGPNCSDSKIKEDLIILKNLGFKICSFDKYEATSNNILFHNTVYRFPINQSSKKIEYDFYFLGEAKDRKELIHSIKDTLLEKGYTCNFIVIDAYKDRISYEENIANLQNCRCIVDIVNPNQQGVTLRPLEATFFGKKLLTNSKRDAIIDLYNENNMLLIDQNNNWSDKINHFFTLPVVTDQKLLNKYDINFWAENIIK